MLKCSNKKRKISPDFNENLPYSHLIFQLKGLPFLPTIGFMEAAPSCKGLRWWLKAVKSPLLQMEVWSLHLGGVRWKILSSTNLKERILYFGGGKQKMWEFFGGALSSQYRYLKDSEETQKRSKIWKHLQDKNIKQTWVRFFLRDENTLWFGPEPSSMNLSKTQGPKVTQKLMVDRIPNSIRFFLVVFCLFKKLPMPPKLEHPIFDVSWNIFLFTRYLAPKKPGQIGNLGLPARCADSCTTYQRPPSSLRHELRSLMSLCFKFWKPWDRFWKCHVIILCVHAWFYILSSCMYTYIIIYVYQMYEIY